MTEGLPQTISDRATRWLAQMRGRMSLQRRLGRGLLVGAVGLVVLELGWLLTGNLPTGWWGLVPLAAALGVAWGPGISLAAAARQIDRLGQLQACSQAFIEAGREHPFRAWLAEELLRGAPRVQPRFRPPRALVPLLCLAFAAALPGLLPDPVDTRLLPQLPRRQAEAAFGASHGSAPLRAAETPLESGQLLSVEEALAALQGTPLTELADAVRAGDVDATAALLAKHEGSEQWAALQQQVQAALGHDALLQAARAAGGDTHGGPAGSVLQAELATETRSLPRREPVPDAYRSLVETWFAEPGGS